MAIIYVDNDANGDNNGSSWEDAYTNLQEALEAAVEDDEIWVAEGIYRPTDTRDRSISFAMKSNVDMYGGFRGNEDNREDRNFRENETILSGNIGEEERSFDNSHHVVTALNLQEEAILDGFTIRDGYSRNVSLEQATVVRGAGILIDSSEVILNNLHIRENQGRFGGGVSILRGSDVVLSNNIFSENTAREAGGGLIITRTVQVDVINNLFVNNRTEGPGAGVYTFRGGGNLVNNTFVNNQGGEAGSAITVENGSDLAVSNVIVWDNPNDVNGDQIFNKLGLPNFTESTITVSDSIVQNGFSEDARVEQENILQENPEFVDLEDDNYRLRSDSPGLEIGNNSVIDIDTDLDGNPRFVGNGVDLGAYEFLLPINEITGDDGDDFLTGDDEDFDLILGLEGDDTLDGGGGGDTLDGGEDDDLLIGGDNSDSLIGDSGSDTLDGGEGSDTLKGGLNPDTLLGGNGNDSLNGDDQDDSLEGNDGDDTLNGNSGNDTIIGGSGRDNVNGAFGDDLLVGDVGNDSLIGGAGDDTLDGGRSPDQLRGAQGNDLYIVDNESDRIVQELVGSAGGQDTIEASVSYIMPLRIEEMILTTSAELDGRGNNINNRITGNSATNRILGVQGNDTLLGLEGDDELRGNSGADVLIGGLGNDELSGGPEEDRFVFNNPNEGVDIIEDFGQEGDNDLIGIEVDGFESDLETGDLPSSQFVLGSSASSSNHRFIYNQDNGDLFFDSDGSGDSEQIQLATLSNSFELTASNFILL